MKIPVKMCEDSCGAAQPGKSEHRRWKENGARSWQRERHIYIYIYVHILYTYTLTSFIQNQVPSSMAFASFYYLQHHILHTRALSSIVPQKYREIHGNDTGMCCSMGSLVYCIYVIVCGHHIALRLRGLRNGGLGGLPSV